MDPVPDPRTAQTGTGVKSRVNSVPEFVLHGKWYGCCKYVFTREPTPHGLGFQKVTEGGGKSK